MTPIRCRLDWAELLDFGLPSPPQSLSNGLQMNDLASTKSAAGKTSREIAGARLPIALALVLVLAMSLVTSCMLQRLKHNVQRIEEHGLVSVTVRPVSQTAPTYALAWRQAAKGKNEMTGFQRVQDEGMAVFLLLQGRTYNIGAFTDINGNGNYDGGEPVDSVKNIQPARLSNTKESAPSLVLKLSTSNGLAPGQSAIMPEENQDLGGELIVTLGAIADLTSPRFSAETGETGMWRPYDFLREHGVGIYFLEPYDAKKLPVLFVYGISGSCQDWSEVLAALDRRKYQPWFYLYPSGIRLDKSANALAGALLLLKQRHGLSQFAVVAHSMGGLVARGAIQRAAAKSGTNLVSKFISISTPWGGHQAAEKGVKHLKFPVPAWRDMSPGSTYLSDIMAQPLPEPTRHELIFGFKSSSGVGLPDDNDGVVAVESELTEKVQAQAHSVYGYHLGHREILRSPAVIQRVTAGLPSLGSKQAAVE